MEDDEYTALIDQLYTLSGIAYRAWHDIKKLVDDVVPQLIEQRNAQLAVKKDEDADRMDLAQKYREAKRRLMYTDCVALAAAEAELDAVVRNIVTFAADAAYARLTSTNMDIGAALQYESECERTGWAEQIACTIMGGCSDNEEGCGG